MNTKLSFKWTISLALILGCGALVFFQPRSFRIPIHISENFSPLVDINIQNQTHRVKFCAWSKYPLCLASSTLENLKTHSGGMGKWRDLKGHKHRKSLLRVDQVKLGPLTIKNALVRQQSDSNDFEKFVFPLDQANLLIDYPRRQIGGIKREADLKKFGIDLSKMHKVPCKIERGIRIEAQSDSGPCQIALMPSANANVVSDRLDSPPSKLQINNKTFDQLQLRPFEIAEAFEADILLGYPFFANHIVYIDAKNSFAYIGERYLNTLSKTSLEKIPVEFTKAGCPVIDITIGKKSYPPVLDLGSISELSIPKHSNIPISKDIQISSSQVINALGKTFSRTDYWLDEISIGKNSFHHVILSKSQGDESMQLELIGEEQGIFDSEDLAFLGNPILNRTNLYFDLTQNGLWFVQNEKDLNKLGISLNDYEQISFTRGSLGIVLQVTTDLGPLCLCLDTGSTGSLISTTWSEPPPLVEDRFGNPSFTTSHTIIGQSDYGELRFHTFKIPQEMGQIDGVLGMNFLRKHPFYIDYQNNLIYFQKAL